MLNLSTEQESPALGMVYGPMGMGKIGLTGLSFQIIVGVGVGMSSINGLIGLIT